MYIVTYTYAKRGDREPKLFINVCETEQEAVTWLLTSLCADDPHETLLRAGRRDAEAGNLDEAYQALDEYMADCLDNEDVMFAYQIRQEDD